MFGMKDNKRNGNDDLSSFNDELDDAYNSPASDFLGEGETSSGSSYASQEPAESVDQGLPANAESVSEPASTSLASRVFKQAPTQILKPSIISEGFELTGDIVSSGGLHVEGKIDGKMQVDSLTVGTKGSVKGSVTCKTLTIKGHFEGDAYCSTLSLSGQAVVSGNIEYHTLIMASGTVLTGNLKRVSS